MISVTNPAEKETHIWGHLSEFCHTDPKHKTNIMQQQLRMLYDRFIHFSCLTMLFCCFHPCPSALGQIMLYVDGMNGVIRHDETIQWLYTLVGSKVGFRISKKALAKARQPLFSKTYF